jgi:hypothetical protein
MTVFLIVGCYMTFIFIFEGCILLRLLLQFFGGPSIATVFFKCFYYYYIPTTCFGPYGPSLGAIYIYTLVTS